MGTRKPAAVPEDLTPDQALNAAQVARRLRVHRNTVKKWTESGVIAVWFHTDSGRPVYSLRTIEAHQQRAGELVAEAARRKAS